MSQTLPEHEPDVRAEAREWLVRLQAEALSNEDIAGWESWIMQDASHQAAYDAAAEAWAIASVAAIRRPTALELQGDTYTGAIPVRGWSRRRPPVRLAWVASIAAVLVAAAAVGLTTWTLTGKEASRQFGTGVAEHDRVMLSDGSQVRMAAMTDLQVDFARSRRDVALKRGEALFTVAHDRNRPFVVATRQAQITAVGTAFDVHVLPRQVVVSVTEGVVRVDPQRPGARPVEVRAGQRLTAGADGVQVVQIGRDSLSSTPWLEGRLEYRSQPLADVLQDVNRYAHTQLVLGDAAAGRLDFTGTVQIASVEDWASALPGVFPLAVEKRGGKVVVRSKSKKSPSAN